MPNLEEAYPHFYINDDIFHEDLICSERLSAEINGVPPFFCIKEKYIAISKQKFVCISCHPSKNIVVTHYISSLQQLQFKVCDECEKKLYRCSLIKECFSCTDLLFNHSYNLHENDCMAKNLLRSTIVSLPLKLNFKNI